MAFRENKCRIRTDYAMHRLSILWCMALNLPCRETTAKGSTGTSRKLAGWNDGCQLVQSQ